MRTWESGTLRKLRSWCGSAMVDEEMCFIPPDCLFCRHYNRTGDADGRDCAAFDEIPECIFRGDIEHLVPFPGDGGVVFDLDPDFAEDYTEVRALRETLVPELLKRR